MNESMPDRDPESLSTGTHSPDGHAPSARPYLTPKTLAELFPGMTEHYVQGRLDTWPHIRIGRRVYFDTECVERIVEMHKINRDATLPAAESHGQRTRRIRSAWS